MSLPELRAAIGGWIISGNRPAAGEVEVVAEVGGDPVATWAIVNSKISVFAIEAYE